MESKISGIQISEIKLKTNASISPEIKLKISVSITPEIELKISVSKNQEK